MRCAEYLFVKMLPLNHLLMYVWESCAIEIFVMRQQENIMLKEFIDVLMQPMAILGLIGQTAFFSRFLVQWIVSEKKGESVVPVAFWYLSIIGGMLMLIYAVWRRDPIFTLGQSIGILVYSRNLMLIHRKGRAAESE